MKYLKTYESETEYSVGDYIQLKQYKSLWSHPNHGKITEIRPIYSFGSFRVYKIIFANQKQLEIHENLIDRKLTEEEIQQYELESLANKYNI